GTRRNNSLDQQALLSKTRDRGNLSRTRQARQTYSQTSRASRKGLFHNDSFPKRWEITLLLFPAQFHLFRTEEQFDRGPFLMRHLGWNGQSERAKVSGSVCDSASDDRPAA